MAADTGTESWSGDQSGTSQVRHRWQSDWSELQNKQFLAPPRRLRRRLTIMFVMFLALFAAFVFSLLYAPVKTPVIAIAATDYAWPLPPNTWAREDVDALASLHQKTLTLMDVSAEWETKERGLSALRSRLRAVSRRGTSNGVVVLYLSMHGAVNADGQPCLIPPGVSPLQSERWLPVRAVIDMIDEALPQRLNKLLILDANRMQVNWHVGILHNTFAERLAETIRRAEKSRLAVLTSSGDDGRGWASADLRASVFGRYVHLGLAGAADQWQPAENGTGGNRDGKVSVHELHQYTAHHVAEWTRHNRGTEQRPQLLPENSKDFTINWSLDRGTLRKLTSAAVSVPGEDAVPVEEIGRLWQQLDGLRRFDPLRHNPIAWRDLEHQLLWLEQLATAGRGYETTAERTASRLSARLTQLTQRLTAASDGDPVVAGIWSDEAAGLADGWKLHSLPLCEYFGQVDPATAAKFRDQRRQAASPGSNLDMEHVLRQFKERELLAQLNEVWFARLLKEQRPGRLWKGNEIVSQSLDIQDKAERLAATGDVRVRGWTQRQLNQLDVARRLAADLLFVGESAVGDDLAANQIESLIESTEDLHQKVAQALGAQDRTLAELPYWAGWLCRPFPDDVDSSRWNDLVNTELLSLVDPSKTLADNPAHRDAEESIDSVVERSQAIHQRFESLEDVSRQVIDDLEHEENAAHAVREIEELLKLPSIPVNERLDLKRKRRSLAAALADEFEPGVNMNESHVAPRYRERLASWNRHPVLAILDVELDDHSEPVASAGWLEKSGDRIRKRLIAISKVAPSPSDDSNDPRRPLAMADRAIRLAASLSVPTPARDPVATLRRFDLQQFMFWHARRAIDDFLGPMPGQVADSDFRPLFETAANSYLSAAESLFPSTQASSRTIEELTQLLESRRAAARRGMVVTAKGGVQFESEATTFDVTMLPGGEDSKADMPNGLAAVYVRDRQRKPLSESRSPVKLPISQSTHLRLTGTEDTAGTSVQAVAFFRGHEIVAPFLLEGISGVTVDFRPHRYDRSQVTLFGTRRKRSSIVFVLDCSWSMRETIAIEAQGTEELSRLELAKSGLEAMLNSLSERTDTRVGVRFYGHRVGWSRSRPVKILLQTDYAGGIPDDLGPAEDVELILPLGRFDATAARKVIARMPSVKPWGQSPLYQALVQSLGDFGADDDDTEKSIVVITDGANYQFQPTGIESAAASPTTRADVLSAWSDRKAPIYIMGFGIAEDEVDEAEREFTTIAERTGGKYFAVNNGRDLLKRLRERLELGRYVVEDPADPAATEDFRLNTAVTVPHSPSPTNYSVRFEAVQREVTIEGGESLELYVSPDGSDIVSRPYDVELPVSGRLAGTQQNRSYTARVHRPVRAGGGVSFPVSIQNEGSHFTRRPAETWIEIVPLDPTGEKHPTYIYYDAHYEPSTPVPVLRWTANRWPDGVNEAWVDVWCKFEKTEPTQAIELRDVERDPVKYAVSRPYNGVDGATIQIHLKEFGASETAFEIKVIEEHQAPSPGVGSFKVDVEAPPGGRPRPVVRQFDADNGIAVHRFQYDRQTAARIREGGTRIILTNRATLYDGAWKLENDRRIRVQVFNVSDVLPLDAATGVR